MKKIYWIGLIGLLIAGLVLVLIKQEKAVEKFAERGSGFVFSKNVEGWENLEQLRSGCPFKDCIESIDKPGFESIKRANLWLDDNDVVFGLDFEGVQKAYPQRILNWHEIVNDNFGLVGVVISFCPLTGSVMGFKTRGGFGVSGKLLNSNLVMYDAETESLWQQITGEAIVGERFGEKLELIHVNVLRWKDWKKLYPQGEVLSRNTGFVRDYDNYPYGNYEETKEIHFPVKGGDSYKIHPKTVVYGIEIGGESKAYTWEGLRRETIEDGVLLDTVGGKRIRISLSAGEVFVENMNDRSNVIARRVFWFGWKAFYPKTKLFK